MTTTLEDWTEAAAVVREDPSLRTDPMLGCIPDMLDTLERYRRERSALRNAMVEMSAPAGLTFTGTTASAIHLMRTYLLQLEQERRQRRRSLATAWSAWLDLAMTHLPDDETPLLRMILESHPTLAAQLREAMDRG